MNLEFLVLAGTTVHVSNISRSWKTVNDEVTFAVLIFIGCASRVGDILIL